MRHIFIHIWLADLGRVVARATKFCMVYFNIFHITIAVLLICDHFECIAQNSPGNRFTGHSSAVGRQYGTSVTLPVLRVLSSSSIHWKLVDSLPLPTRRPSGAPSSAGGDDRFAKRTSCCDVFTVYSRI